MCRVRVISGIIARAVITKPEVIGIMINAHRYAIDAGRGNAKAARALTSRDLPVPGGSLGDYKEETVFGWVAAGSISENSLSKISASNISFSTTNNEPTLENLLQRFWLIEDVSDTSPYTIKERTCQEYFKNTVIRNNEGRFVVCLPFRDDVIKLGKPYGIAKPRFLAIERKFQKDNKLKEEYCSFMKEYELLNHMERLDTNETENAEQTYYLLHQAVRKDSSTSTKLRVVFDAFCKTDTGISLNDVLSKGPIYRLNAVTYGTVPASYLATGCLQVLAETVREQYPYITHIINRDFYMDDLLIGADMEKEVIKIRDGLIAVMNSAGLTLRKWLSNDSNLITSSLPCEDIEISD
ncbi:DUF1758 domain-containing protein [Aphis craccivora]|uniref:DUF1758 domain-containing protein n=1 Tax=Aphis craccivora TaxID=307492 RepID=A0A6G0Y3I2_APHCR|nr:DUF1758 domain-containing protein [Aphis craccivora]